MNTREPEDLTGQRFGRWTVIERANPFRLIKGKGRYYLWKCKCDCGTIRVVRSNILKSGQSKSCGCLGKRRCARVHTDQLARYNVWENKTDDVIAIDMTARECAEAMGIKIESFYSALSRQRSGLPTHWFISESEDEE